jgi:uncharacterized surface protein with fasciclin (FAS1) repeats
MNTRLITASAVLVLASSAAAPAVTDPMVGGAAMHPTCNKTVEGGLLTISRHNGSFMVTDEKGDTARVTIPDVYQLNGVTMVVDKVLMP